MKTIILVIVGLIVVVGAGWWIYSATNGFSTAASSTASSTDTPAFNNTVNNTNAASSTSAAATSSMDTSTPSKVTSATLHTSMGDITIAFYPDQAPATVANFIKLASSGFYDNTKFHRVIEGFMDQIGDPLTKDDSQMARWGTGGPGYTIADEFGTTYTNVAGTVAMANTGQSNSGGSQFFFNAVDNHFLDGKYSVFAYVTAGMDVVTAINNVPTDSNDRPITPVVLKSITLK